MRTRDVNALAFCVGSTLAVLFLAKLVFGGWLPAGALAGAYGALVLTRPRMLRVFRRLRGESVERSGYFQD